MDNEVPESSLSKEPRKRIKGKQKQENAVHSHSHFEQMGFFTEELDGFHKQITLYDKEILPPSPQKTTQEANLLAKKEVISERLKNYLQKSGYEVIDKRKNGGALWLIGGEELEPLVNELSLNEKVLFKFSKKGSKSTKHRPSWYTKSTN